MAKVLVPLADGCEEMEAVIIIDTLRRAGWEVTSVGLEEGPITASRGVRILPDKTWGEIDPSAYDIFVLPGGAEGTEHLCGDERVLATIRAFHRDRKRIAAICAGPLVLQEAGVLDATRVTCHPSVVEQLTQAVQSGERVVIDGLITTSQGPGTSFEFALSIIAQVDGQQKSDEIARAMVVNY